MKKRAVCFVVLPLLILFLVSTSSSFAIDLEDADALGCSDGIVNIGDTKSDVLEKCGEPTRKERSSPSDHFTLPEPNIWIYDFGSSSFVYFLTFTRGKVERIQTGGYGN